MIELLNAGVTVESLLRMIECRLARAAITRALAPVIRIVPLTQFAEAAAYSLVIIHDEDFLPDTSFRAKL
jgi:hypothetical protein